MSSKCRRVETNHKPNALIFKPDGWVKRCGHCGHEIKFTPEEEEAQISMSIFGLDSEELGE